MEVVVLKFLDTQIPLGTTEGLGPPVSLGLGESSLAQGARSVEWPSVRDFGVVL